MIKDVIGVERHVDYISKPLKLFGYQFVQLKVAGGTVSNARLLVTPNSGELTGT